MQLVKSERWENMQQESINAELCTSLFVPRYGNKLVSVPADVVLLCMEGSETRKAENPNECLHTVISVVNSRIVTPFCDRNSHPTPKSGGCVVL